MSAEPLPFPARPAGSPLGRAQRNEAKLFALQIVRDPEYRSGLLRAARARKLPPAIETMLWHYAYGKPVEKIDIGLSTDELEEMSDLELAKRAAMLAAVLSRTQDEVEARAATDEALNEQMKRDEVPVD